MEIKKFMRVKPIARIDGSLHTGFGFILAIVDTNKWILGKGFSDDPKSYVICTDFGNTFTYTRNELLTAYELGEVDNPKERLLKQIDNLTDIYRNL